VSAPRRCQACGSPLAGDQHYCLGCGTRAGGRSAQLESLLGRMRAGEAPASADGLPAEGIGAGPVAPPRWEPRLPGPRISMLLVLLFVGFGALLGDAGAGAGRLTAATPSLKVVVPHNTGLTSAAESPAKTSEPPASEPEATPQPAEAPGSSGEEHAAAETSPQEAGSAPATGGNANRAPAKAKTGKLSDIKHVFLVVLSNQPYAADFGPETKASYLAHTLESKGELLLRYDAVAHEQLPNGIALLSGQGPTAQTAADCPTYTPLSPGGAGSDEQALGDGCIYPAGVKTLPGQLTARHLTWKAYVQGIDEGAGTPPACSHPAGGSADPTYASGAYATYRNPFVYFESITASPTCAANDVGLDKLPADLRSASSTPSFSYIVPGRCEDAGPTPCAPGAPSGPTDAMALLGRIVPQIMASQAYKHGGLIVITSDEAPSTGEYADSSSCCGQPPYPNLTTVGLRHGGGVVGALLLSPLIKGGTTAQEPYNHYSLLRTVEDVFGLRHIGYAALPAVRSFSPTLLNAHAKG
jgi:phosphatidylinositol-3-phosphatase